MKKLLFALALLLSSPAMAAQTHPGGANGSIQVNNNAGFGGLSADTLASYAAHNTISNGISYDPRDPAYGAICGGYNLYTGNGSQTAFAYTIPFTGSGSTDNSGFMVFYEPTNGFGTATILSTSDFTVTGVNSGVGGVVTLNSAVPAGNNLVIVHDDSAGLIAASAAAVLSGGHVVVPNNCTIYGSQTLGTQLAEGAQLIGQGFTPNYLFQGQGVKPIMRVIAPSGFAPAFGINISGKNQQFFEGFEITTNVPGNNSLGFLAVPVLIGANTSAGAGGGQSPGIVAQYMTFNSGSVGFGSPISGGVSAYIFSVLRFNNFTSNNAGVYGPLSDQQVIGNNFNSNGAFGSYGSAGGMVIGPQQGAPGSSGAARLEYNRFEFNSEGLVIKNGGLINMEGNEFDGNASCGMNLNGVWANINVTGGWFRGNGNGGGSYRGTTTAGKDAHVCINGSSTGNRNLTFHNVNFFTNFMVGNINPIGSINATTPVYLLDVNASGADNDYIEFIGGTASGITGNNGAYITDFTIFRNGKPPHFKVDVSDQAVQGKLVNGRMLSQVAGISPLAPNSYTAYGDEVTYYQFYTASTLYPYLINSDLNGALTNRTTPFGFDCDVVDQNIFANANPGQNGNQLVSWLPSVADPTFGAPVTVQTAHEAITHQCRLAGLTWLAIPSTYKVLGQDAACVQSGTWSNDTRYGGSMGVTSSTNGDTLTCSITTNGGPIYLDYQMVENDNGTFTYALDGGAPVTVPTNGNNIFSYPVASHHSVGAFRLPVLTTGSHTVVITVTSATAAGNVYFESLSTPPEKPYLGQPSVYYGGQLPTLNNASYPTAVAAYNADQKTDAAQLNADGLSVNFVDVQNYVNSTTDMTSATGGLIPSTTGQIHIHDAFEGVMQFTPVASGPTVDPRNFGAACNTQMFNANFNQAGNHAVTTTAGSPVVSVANYTFKAGVATATGGGDVGKVWTSGAATNQGPTTYVLSVDTGANTATLGANMLVSSGSGAAKMGGYPTNPADPSTAIDDTAAIQNASAAAATGGKIVSLPPNCFVHNLVMASQTALVGSNGGNDYNEFLGYPHFTNTPLYVAASGFSDDIDVATGKARSVGIDITRSTQTKFKDFTLVCGNFPYNPTGMYLAGIGEQTPTATDLSPDHVFIDHLTITSCPVAYGMPIGTDFPVVFTADISGTTMNVTAITSNNFQYLYTGNGTPADFLAVGRPVTEASFTGSIATNQLTVTAVASGTITVGQRLLVGSPAAGTTITALGTGTGGTGTYTISTSATLSSRAFTSGTIITGVPTNGTISGTTGAYTVADSHTQASQSMTSTPSGFFTSGTMQNTQMAQNGMGINGALSDFTWENNVGTNYSWCVYLGPATGAGSAGTSANRFNGGRCETGGGMLFDGGGNDQLTGMQFQATTCAIKTVNSGVHLQVTGGWMQGNNCGTTGAYSQVLIGGSWVGVDFSGVNADFHNFGGGHNASSNYFLSTDVGSTSDYISVEGGDMRLGFSTAFRNFTNQTPTHYKQNVPGLPIYDTTQTKFTASGCSNSATLGNATSGQFTSGTSGTCTVVLTPYGASSVAQPNGWTCSGTDVTTGAALLSTGSTTTTCTIAGATTSGDTVTVNMAPY